jgi:hypothetical protein
MGRESTTKMIDGEEYSFYQLGGLASNKLLWRVKRIIGPSLIGLINGMKGDKEASLGEKLEKLLESDINFEEVANGFYERATETEVDHVISKLLSQVTHNGDGALNNDGAIDRHFKGHLKRMYKVLWEAFKHEYSDFFPESGITASLDKEV